MNFTKKFGKNHFIGDSKWKHILSTTIMILASLFSFVISWQTYMLSNVDEKKLEYIRGYVTYIDCRDGFKRNRILLHIDKEAFNTTSRLIPFQQDCVELIALLDNNNRVSLIVNSKIEITYGREITSFTIGEQNIFGLEDWKKHQLYWSFYIFIFASFISFVCFVSNLKSYKLYKAEIR